MLRIAVSLSRGRFFLDAAFTTPHQRVVLFGPSGAGKSLTLQSLAGFVTPDHGRIEVNDTVLFDDALHINVPPWRRRVGVVLQAYTLLPHLTAGANVAYGLAPIWRGRERVRVETLLAAVGLGGFNDRMPAQLSGGQRQRVALAQALASDPRLLLLDEPFSAVDAPVRERLRRDLLTLLEAFPVPLVFVTHDFGEAYLLGETIVILAGGRVVQIGSPADVAAHPRTATVARLVGATNILEGQVLGRSSDGVTLRVGNLVVQAQASSRRAGDTVTFCLRPEDVRLVPGRPDAPTATVTRILPRNGVVTVLMSVGEFTLEGNLAGPPPAVGTRVGLDIPAGAAQVLDHPDEGMTE